MSVTATAAASAASSIADLHPHNHKKAVHLDSGTTPATTQGLFSSLLHSVEQVASVHALASAAVAAIKAVNAKV